MIKWENVSEPALTEAVSGDMISEKIVNPAIIPVAIISTIKGFPPTHKLTERIFKQSRKHFLLSLDHIIKHRIGSQILYANFKFPNMINIHCNFGGWIIFFFYKFL